MSKKGTKIGGQEVLPGAVEPLGSQEWAELVQSAKARLGRGELLLPVLDDVEQPVTPEVSTDLPEIAQLPLIDGRVRAAFMLTVFEMGDLGPERL